MSLGKEKTLISGVNPEHQNRARQKMKISTKSLQNTLSKDPLQLTPLSKSLLGNNMFNHKQKAQKEAFNITVRDLHISLKSLRENPSIGHH